MALTIRDYTGVTPDRGQSQLTEAGGNGEQPSAEPQYASGGLQLRDYTVGSNAGSTPPPPPPREERVDDTQNVVAEEGGESFLPDFLTGADRETRATRELPEIVYSGLLNNENVADSIKAAGLLLTTTSNREIASIITKQFPSIKQTEDEKGNIILFNEKNGVRAVVNKPGFSPTDVSHLLGLSAAFTPAGRVASLLPTLGGKVAVGTLTAGATEAGLQAGQAATGGTFDPADVLLSASLGTAGELAGFGVKKLRRKISGPEDVPQNILDAEASARSLDSGLFPGQITQDAAILEKQSFVASLPAGSEIAAKALKKQNREAYNAVDKFLLQIAPEEAVMTGSGKIRSAAEKAIGNLKTVRSERASPFYRDAFASNTRINPSSIRDTLTDVLQELPKDGHTAKTLKKVKNLLTPPGGATDVSVQYLHNVKLDIDQMISKMGSRPTSRRELLKAKEQILDIMDNAIPEYKEARRMFAVNSPAVDKMEDSVIGKIANLSDEQLETASRVIFNPSRTNKSTIQQAKATIEGVDPSAWKEIMRVEMERRIGSIKADALEDTIENIPGQMHRVIFGNKKNREILYNAVDGEMKKNMRFLETYLKRASLGRPGGSQTGSRVDILSDLDRGFLKSLRAFIAPGASAGMAVMAWSKLKRTKKLAELVYDPKWVGRIREIRDLGPETPASFRAAVQMFTDLVDDDKPDEVTAANNLDEEIDDRGTELE